MMQTKNFFFKEVKLILVSTSSSVYNFRHKCLKVEALQE